MIVRHLECALWGLLCSLAVATALGVALQPLRRSPDLADPARQRRLVAAAMAGMVVAAAAVGWIAQGGPGAVAALFGALPLLGSGVADLRRLRGNASPD